MQEVVFANIQRAQKVEDILNEFKPTCLVSKRVGGCTEWEGRPLGGQGDWDSVVHAIVFGRVQRVQKVEEMLNEFV